MIGSFGRAGLCEPLDEVRGCKTYRAAWRGLIGGGVGAALRKRNGMEPNGEAMQTVRTRERCRFSHPPFGRTSPERTVRVLLNATNPSWIVCVSWSDPSSSVCSCFWCRTHIARRPYIDVRATCRLVTLFRNRRTLNMCLCFGFCGSVRA